VLHKPLRMGGGVRRKTLHTFNVEKGSPGDEPGRAPRWEQRSEGEQPHERERHETRPQRQVRMNATRTCETSRWHGVGLESDERLHQAVKRCRGEKPQGRMPRDVDRKSRRAGGTVSGSLKGG